MMTRTFQMNLASTNAVDGVVLTVTGTAYIDVDHAEKQDVDGNRAECAEFIDNIEIEKVLDGTADITKSMPAEMAEWILEQAYEHATKNL